MSILRGETARPQRRPGMKAICLLLLIQMLAMQTETMRLRQENQKLLLDHQPTVQTAESPKDFEDIEEEIQQVDPVMATAAPKSSRVGWVALSIGVVTMLGWLVLQQAPDVQLRLTELVQ